MAPQSQSVRARRNHALWRPVGSPLPAPMVRRALTANGSRMPNQADIKGMNPALAALRARHDGLAAEHEEMRAHAVTLVQKCRQAETVNEALQRECARLRASAPPQVHAARACVGSVNVVGCS